MDGYQSCLAMRMKNRLQKQSGQKGLFVCGSGAFWQKRLFKKNFKKFDKRACKIGRNLLEYYSLPMLM